MQSDSISIDNTPAIAGLRFRRFRGAEDFPSILSVMDDCIDIDKLERVPTLEDLASYYDRLENCDPRQDMIFAEIHGQVIGYLRGYWWKDLDLGLRYAHIGIVVPKWRRKGIGTAMLNWVERRLHEISTAHPPDLAKHFQTTAFEFQQANIRLLARAGYSSVRYFEQMVRSHLDDLPEFALPDGLSIRAAVPEHYRAIWQVVAETFRDCWGCAEFTEESYQAWLADKAHFQPHLWQVAWDDSTNQIIGHVLTFIDRTENDSNQRQRGYTEVIGVCRSWRKRGVARALIVRSLQAQKAIGMTESALGVDSTNPSGANRLYEQCGFQTVKRQIVFAKPL